MRKIKLIILTCLISLIAVNVNAKEKGKYDWSRVINAIIQVESGGNPKARNANGDCAGIMQITPVLVKQCNIWLQQAKSNKRYTLKDRYDVEKSKEMFIMMQEHCNPSNSVEKAIRMWNGGPKYSTSATEGYYRKVMKHYKGGK